MNLDSMAQLKAIANPQRMQLLQEFAREPATTKQIATRLAVPPTRLYHHVAVLEKAGLLKLVETRKLRGTTEKYYTTTAESFRLDQQALGEAAGAPGLAVVDNLLSNARQEVRNLLAAKPDDMAMVQESIFVGVEVCGSKRRVEQLRRRISEMIAEFEQEPKAKSDQDERMRLLLGWYPLLDVAEPDKR